MHNLSNCFITASVVCLVILRTPIRKLIEIRIVKLNKYMLE